MGLAKSKLGLRRRNVENGRAGEYDKHKRNVHSRCSEYLQCALERGQSFFYAD